MKAVLLYGKNDLRVSHKAAQVTSGKSQDVLIEVHYCGICGTDLKEYTTGPIFGPVPGESHPYSGIELPYAMGHEYAGIVKAVGRDVKSLAVGDKVVVDVSFACEDQNDVPEPCYSCIHGSVNACKRLCLRGLSAPGGGLAEYTVIPASRVHKLDPETPLEIGAMVQPLSISWHAVRISRFETGATALVIGAGPIGLATILALLARKASRIIVAEPSPIRREQACAMLTPQFGKETAESYIIDPTFAQEGPVFEAVVEKIRSLGKENEGLDFAYDCAGFPATMRKAILCIKPRGVAVNVAIWSGAEKVAFKPMDVTYQEKTYMGSMGLESQDVDEVIAALADGSIDLAIARQMITKIVTLDEAVEEGFGTLLKDKANHVKVLISPLKEPVKV
ncbi:glycerol dehydrogenase [Nadsonia fulvescens var. elongata DSM 6958]|uniref:Glycerol dehydrogenase n=1 Tax=Nadsonia fulvescens var. elongata DSM 6958 TaxID=857566 RepID=A0A1E3PFJ9_9ASCO|nr:glycerol dehydrogenase [Nadsonia fulvescens var. elongata DSM 6958]